MKEVFHEVRNKVEVTPSFRTSSFSSGEKIESVGQEVLPEGSETISTLSEPTTVYYSSEPQQLSQLLQQPLLPDTWYKTRVEIIRKMYPELMRHKKTKRKSWKEVYNEYIAEMRRIPSLKADAIK
jgi:hypothetical protein